MGRFEAYLEALSTRIEGLAKSTLEDFFNLAVQGGEDFLEKTRGDLERWTTLLAKGELTKEDFAWLVKGKMDLANLEALEQKGLALARLDGFRVSLIETVVQTAFDLFLG
jgi:hypothetical protein